MTLTLSYAKYGREVVRVGLPCRMPAGDPGHHTSIGRVADRLLTPTNERPS